MFRFKNHPANHPFLHDQLFTLTWQLEDVKWVLIRYKNSQRKKWYRRTERPYRFRRWFFRKGIGSFSNLANIHAPYIHVYIFSSYIAWPKKMVIPIPVNRLILDELPVQALAPVVSLDSPVASFLRPSPEVVYTPLAIPELSFPRSIAVPSPVISTFPETPSCTWSVAKWIEHSLVDEHQLNYEKLDHLTKLPTHV